MAHEQRSISRNYLSWILSILTRVLPWKQCRCLTFRWGPTPSSHLQSSYPHTAESLALQACVGLPARHEYTIVHQYHFVVIIWMIAGPRTVLILSRLPLEISNPYYYYLSLISLYICIISVDGGDHAIPQLSIPKALARSSIPWSFTPLS